MTSTSTTPSTAGGGRLLGNPGLALRLQAPTLKMSLLPYSAPGAEEWHVQAAVRHHPLQHLARARLDAQRSQVVRPRLAHREQRDGHSSRVRQRAQPVRTPGRERAAHHQQRVSLLHAAPCLGGDGGRERVACACRENRTRAARKLRAEEDDLRLQMAAANGAVHHLKRARLSHAHLGVAVGSRLRLSHPELSGRQKQRWVGRPQPLLQLRSTCGERAA